MPKLSLIIGVAALIAVGIGATFIIDPTGSKSGSSSIRSSSRLNTSSVFQTTVINPTNTSGQPIVVVTSTDIPRSIQITGGNNITVSCQQPLLTSSFGTVSISNQGTGGASLKILVIQYSALSSFATARVTGQYCSAMPPNSSVTLYVSGLPVAPQAGSYYDGWFVLTSGAQTNVFSGQFTG